MRVAFKNTVNESFNVISNITQFFGLVQENPQSSKSIETYLLKRKSSQG